MPSPLLQGDNSHGQLGDGTIVDHSIPARVGTLGQYVFTEIAAGNLHTCALLKDVTGNARCWGAFKAMLDQLVLPTGAVIFIEVSAHDQGGLTHPCILFCSQAPTSTGSWATAPGRSATHPLL